MIDHVLTPCLLRDIAIAATTLALFTSAVPATAGAATTTERVQVIEPYVELRSGPGRGYPVFHVAPRADWIEILRRKTDWFLVRTDEGKQGWVKRQELERTFTEAGFPKRFRDSLLDTYLAERLEIGLLAGHLEGNATMTIVADYEFTPLAMAELALEQISGTFNSAYLVGASLVSRPFSNWTYRPYFTLGFAHFFDTPRTTLVDPAATDSPAAVLGFGVQVPLSRRFALRGDYRNFVILIDDEKTKDFDQFSAGFTVLF